MYVSWLWLWSWLEEHWLNMTKRVLGTGLAYLVSAILFFKEPAFCFMNSHVFSSIETRHESSKTTLTKRGWANTSHYHYLPCVSTGQTGLRQNPCLFSAEPRHLRIRDYIDYAAGGLVLINSFALMSLAGRCWERGLEPGIAVPMVADGSDLAILPWFGAGDRPSSLI